MEWQRSSIDLTYDENVADAMRLYGMLDAIDSCPAPVVARVQGFALGGGAGVVACADVVVAGRDAVFGFTEVRLGIIPAVISPFVLPRIGTGAARRYFLTGERFDAEAALRIGLVHEIAEDLDGAVGRVVDHLLAAGPEAVRAAKRLIRERPLGEATAHIAAALRTGPEGQEGLARLPGEASGNASGGRRLGRVLRKPGSRVVTWSLRAECFYPTPLPPVLTPQVNRTTKTMSAAMASRATISTRKTVCLVAMSESPRSSGVPGQADPRRLGVEAEEKPLLFPNSLHEGATRKEYG